MAVAATRIDWGRHLRRVVRHVSRERAHIAEVSVRNFGLREDYAFRPELVQQRRGGRLQLERWERCRARMVEQLAVRKGVRLSSDQVRLLDEIRNAMIVKMYGGIGNVKADLSWLRERLHIDEIHDTVAVVYPRRHGKTLMQTLASAITLLAVPTGNVVSYNPEASQARAWMTYCIDHLRLLKDDPEFGWSEVRATEGKFLCLSRRAGGDEVSVQAYGNATNRTNAQRLRGSGNYAYLINVDEGLFFHVEAFKVIWPTVANGAALVLTSSKPPNRQGSLDILSGRHPDTGEAAWRILDWRPRCELCKTLEEQRGGEVICRHLRGLPPPSIRSRTDDIRQQALLAPIGAYDTEMQNLDALDPAQPVFDPASIDAAVGFNAREVRVETMQTHFFIGIDPGSSVTRSDTAITSISFVRQLFGFPEVPRDAHPYTRHCVVRTLLLCRKADFSYARHAIRVGAPYNIVGIDSPVRVIKLGKEIGDLQRSREFIVCALITRLKWVIKPFDYHRRFAKGWWQ
jgi:hypothetical protein